MAANQNQPAAAEILATIHQGQNYLLRLRRADGSWQIPAYLGPVYICQFYLLCQWAGLKTKLDESVLQELLLSRQLEDGSWYQIKDINAPGGELNVHDFDLLDFEGDRPTARFNADEKGARVYFKKWRYRKS